MKHYKNYKTLDKFANAVARQSGYGMATSVEIGGRKPEVIEHIDFGYRKFSDNTYVSNAYRANFGWKNTYYQQAETTVRIPKYMLNHLRV